jgi:hypothetical protein
MRHTVRLETVARSRLAAREKGSGVWEVQKGGVAPGSGPLDRTARREGGREEGKEGSRRAPSPARPANATPQARTGPGLPAGDLPAHRLVGQLAHAIELLLHRGPAAALVPELGKDRAARSPPQGYMAPARSLRATATAVALRRLREPSGPRAAPSRGHLRLLLLQPRRLLPHPPPAHRTALLATPGGGPRSPPGPPGLQPPAPSPQPPTPSPARGPGSLRRLPGRLAGGLRAPVQGRRACWDL